MTNTTTYEFTAFAEDDLASDGNLSCGDTFTMPGNATICFSVTDNDSRLSGDSRCNENANDHSYQTASIIDAATGEELGNGGQIYGESYHWVSDQNGNWYVLIEIEQEGTGDDYFTFYTGHGYSIPPEGTQLTVHSQCNISDWEPDFKCLGAGDKLELGTIKGTVWCDDDCDGIFDSSTTTTKGENLLQDGDFEAGHTIYNAGGYGAWYDAGNDSGDIVQGNAQSHGGNAADNGIWELDKGSILCQIFDAPAAGKYCLTFDVYNNDCIGKYDDRFKVKINGQTVETVKVTADGSVTIELDLAAGENRLDFVSLSQVWGRGPGIDNIELRQEITTTDSEAPKEGVTIKLLADLDNDGEIDDVVETTVTDENGNYSFDEIAAGDYKIMGVAPDGTEFTIQDAGSDDSVDSDVDGNGMSGVISLGAGDTADIDLGLKEVKTGSIAGRYFCDTDNDDLDNGNGNEPAVPAQIVVLLNADGSVVLDGNNDPVFTTTDSNGEYLFEDIEAGDYKVGFAPVDGKGFVAQGADADGNGESDDPAASDVNPDQEGMEVQIDVDNDGNPDSVQIVMTDVFTLDAGEDKTDVDAGVEDLPGSLSGRYFCDDDGDGLDNDGADNGIEGILVTLLDSNGDPVLDGAGDPVTTRTGSDGSYSFGGLDAGTYGVKFTDETGDLTAGKFLTETDANGNTNDDIDSDAVGDNVMSTISDIEVVAGQDTPNNDAGVVPLGSIAGRYFCDENDNDVDDAEPGINGLTVTLINADTGDVLATQVTDTIGGVDGSYFFGDLAAGNYQVIFPADPDGKTFVAPNDPNGNGNGDDTDDSDAVPNSDGTASSQVIPLGVGENVTDVDAGVENLAPDAQDDAGEVCYDDVLLIDALDNDSDANGDPLSIVQIEGQDVVAGDVVTLANGIEITINGDGTLSIDGENAVIGGTATADLLAGETLSDTFEYTISDGNGGTDTANVTATFKGATDSVDKVIDSLQGVLGTEICFQITDATDTPDGGDLYTLQLSGTGDPRLDGLVIDEAYCLAFNEDILFGDPLEPIGNAPLLKGNVFLADDASIPAGALTGTGGNGQSATDNLDLINWILNQDFGSIDNGDGTGETYTDGEIQGAIWALTDSVLTVASGNGTDANALEIFQFALNDANRDGVNDGGAEGFEVGGVNAGIFTENNNIVGLFIDPTTDTELLGHSQPFMVGVNLFEDCIC